MQYLAVVRAKAGAGAGGAARAGTGIGDGQEPESGPGQECRGCCRSGGQDRNQSLGTD